LIAELRDSPKERAELAMIVDLVRNDLGRISVPGAIRVEPRVIRSHANVHHASQRVHARLKPGIDSWDGLAALFPPGSVTGAPKVSASRKIAELETEPRGVYCGAVGYCSGARARWSVAIRTAVWDGDSVRWHVGGGIVAGSDPEAEWEETVAKGLALAVLAG
jgi:para-aminobenzoate synthetase component 1